MYKLLLPKYFMCLMTQRF